MNRKVAIYARVSTEHEAQLSALENQVQYYDKILESHPDWDLYDRYIDEGITGTSIAKRKSFMRMMEDAERKCFDLIITREVSRFARNTVDTLQETRKLKRLGIEVWFTEDNIWTLNDEDGELRLTIMATLAQNESKKTSLRVKAGQRVSFQNAVPYGTGNILGYDRVDKYTMVINEEQAKTVRYIFDRYLAGDGLRKIQFDLEKNGMKTAMGCSRWHCTVINKVLTNPFYCGTIVYQKEIVLDYLEQKRVKNTNTENRIVVEGKHTPIVSKEEFEEVQRIMSKHRIVKNDGKDVYGCRGLRCVWSKKLICSCGSKMNKKKWHTNKETHVTQFAYECCKQVRTGSYKYRLKHGLSVDNICQAPMTQEWKLQLMAATIFQNLWQDTSGAMKIAEELLQRNITYELDNNRKNDIEHLATQYEKLKKRLDKLIEMRLSEEISKEIFNSKKQEIEDKMSVMEDKLAEYAQETEKQVDLDKRLEVLRYALREDFQFDKSVIPDKIIDGFVDKIVVYPDHYEWFLNFDGTGVIKCNVGGNKRNPHIEVLDYP